MFPQTDTIWFQERGFNGHQFVGSALILPKNLQYDPSNGRFAAFKAINNRAPTDEEIQLLLTQQEKEEIKNSLITCGFIESIVVEEHPTEDNKFIIINGNERVSIAKKEKLIEDNKPINCTVLKRGYPSKDKKQYMELKHRNDWSTESRNLYRADGSKKWDDIRKACCSQISLKAKQLGINVSTATLDYYSLPKDKLRVTKIKNDEKLLVTVCKLAEETLKKSKSDGNPSSRIVLTQIKKDIKNIVDNWQDKKETDTTNILNDKKTTPSTTNTNCLTKITNLCKKSEKDLQNIMQNPTADDIVNLRDLCKIINNISKDYEFKCNTIQ